MKIAGIKKLSQELKILDTKQADLDDLLSKVIG